MAINILTVKELSELVKIKEKTIYYLVSQGSIPHYRIGKLVRFKQDEIERWMESKKAKPLEKPVDKMLRSVYTPKIGRPDRLAKEVIDCFIKEARSGG
ncbi:MAG: helix-turn-helix domain-containing protein [Thermodesulfovibrionia bacterium]|nr:helix-turn-helix domain-containing protein [Thermodesulfovibrionia bacterium]